MQAEVRTYLSQIGRKGGRTSRRTLTPEQARAMVRVREAQRLYREYHTDCFWSYDPAYKITSDKVPWVADRLRRFGGYSEWHMARKLCR